VWTGGPNDELRLHREISSGDDEEAQQEELLLAWASAGEAIQGFAASKQDLVLGGTFADLPLTRQVRLPRGTLRFDPASGLFGLVPLHAGGPIDRPEVRQLLAEAIDRGNFVAALGVPDLAARATLLEPGLDGNYTPSPPPWFATPLGDRLAALRADSERLFGKTKPTIELALPQGPGADLLFGELARDWGAIGITVLRAAPGAAADFSLLDEVAPSPSPSWFVRRFRCGLAPVCDQQADALMDAARQSPVPAQRYALLAQAAARIDDAELFIPITAPVRWSLVSARVQNFAGNRYARHTLTGLEQQAGSD
jgi:peptide/nickel transport system substrate-binding protein